MWLFSQLTHINDSDSSWLKGGGKTMSLPLCFLGDGSSSNPDVH